MWRVRARVVQAIDGQNCTNGLWRHGPRCRQAHPSAHGLDEADRRRRHLGFRPDVRQVHRREADRARADADGRRADVALAQVAVADDPAIFHVDEGSKLVRLPEPIGTAKLLEILDPIGRGLVVVGHTHLERDLREAGDGVRRDPGDRCHRGLEPSTCHDGSPRQGRDASRQGRQSLARPEGFEPPTY